MTTNSLVLRTGESHLVADAETAALLAVGAAKDKCRSDIVAAYPEYRQRNAALGLYDETYVAAMRAHILACKLIEDAYTGAVESIIAGAGTDAEKVAAIAAL